MEKRKEKPVIMGDCEGCWRYKKLNKEHSTQLYLCVDCSKKTGDKYTGHIEY